MIALSCPVSVGGEQNDPMLGKSGSPLGGWKPKAKQGSPSGAPQRYRMLVALIRAANESSPATIAFTRPLPSHESCLLSWYLHMKAVYQKG